MPGSSRPRTLAPVRTWYERLGVATDATPDEIHRAYRRLARRTHPDAPGGDAARMAELNEAWRVLSDPSRRARYDAGLRAGARSPDDPADDGTDGGPAPGPGSGRRRFPVFTVLALVTVAVLFIGSAYARRDPSAPAPSPVDGVIEPGSCVQILPGDLVEEVPCSGPRAGTASAVLQPGSVCPSPTGAFIDRRLRTVCVLPG